jgi:hypothetical protein
MPSWLHALKEMSFKPTAAHPRIFPQAKTCFRKAALQDPTVRLFSLNHILKPLGSRKPMATSFLSGIPIRKNSPLSKFTRR